MVQKQKKLPKDSLSGVCTLSVSLFVAGLVLPVRADETGAGLLKPLAVHLKAADALLHGTAALSEGLGVRKKILCELLHLFGGDVLSQRKILRSDLPTEVFYGYLVLEALGELFFLRGRACAYGIQKKSSQKH